MPQPFRDRSEAGQILGAKLATYKHDPNVIVLGLPRGGVPVAFEIAQILQVQMDVFLVRKIGVPGHEELAMGAIASGNVQVINEQVVNQLGLSSNQVEHATRAAYQELQRRENLYRKNRPPLHLHHKTAILVDDGLATGASMRAAAAALRQHQPARIIGAVPVAAPEVCDSLRSDIDEMVCALTPSNLHAISFWYKNFEQTTDDDVQHLLSEMQPDEHLYAFNYM
jgi:putative phosphoribosyl transferase